MFSFLHFQPVKWIRRALTIVIFVFTAALPIFAQTITVLVPNGGENWEVGSTQTITWASGGTVGKVKIEYSTDNGGSWKNIKASTDNTGSYSWEIPNEPSTSCLVKVSEKDGDPSDTSDATFSIIAVPGQLNVVISPKEVVDLGAGWKLTGEDTWHGSGDTVAYSPSEDYTLEFKPVSGWSKPPDKSIKIKMGQTTYETGTYEKIYFVTNKEIVTIPEGGQDTFKVKLSAEPSSGVLVAVSKMDGDEHIAVLTDSLQLIFNPDDWNEFQTVTLAAAEDDDVENGQAIIIISAPGIDNKEIIAVEEDNDELGFVTDKKRVTVPEGGTDTFKVKLSGKPLSELVVTISMAGDADSDITLVPDSDPFQLTFTPDDWNKFQTVTLAAAEDDDLIDGEAIIQIRAEGVEGEDIIAVEQDNDTADISLKLNPHTGTTGNIIKISIDIASNTEEINAFGLKFIYDSGLFTLKSIKKGSLTSDWSMIGGEEEDSGTITIGGAAGGGQPVYVDSQGTLVRIWLKVKCQSLPSETASEVWVDEYLDGIEGFSPDPCTATITLVPCSRVGDVNGDGHVTPGDAQNTLEIYLGRRVANFCQGTTADSNGDENTTPGDAQDIFECYLGKRDIPECHEDGSAGTSSAAYGSAGASSAASFESFRKTRDTKRRNLSKSRSLYPLNTIGYSGKTINIPVVIADPEGISSFSFEVNYLPELLEYKGIKRTQLTEDFDYLEGIEEIDGLVRIEGESKQPITYDKYASLAVLVFRVKEGVSGNLPLIVFNPGKDIYNVEIDDGNFLGIEYLDGSERFLNLGESIILPGMIMRVPVEVSNAFDVKSFGLEIEYPTEKMVFAGINRGELTKNFTAVEGNESEPGLVRVGGYSMSGIQERKPGMLVEVVFWLKEMGGKIEIVKLVDDIQDFIIQKRRIRMNEKKDREKKLWHQKLRDYR